MTEKTLTTENIKPALDALRGELAPWPVVAMKQDKLNSTQKSAVNSGITSSLVAQIIANTAAIRALESAITGTGLRALVVSSLPAVGTQGILYIVPVTTYDPETDADVVNYSNEYLWIVAPDAPVTEGYYEQVGQTGIVINNGQLNITVNGTSVGTFTANQSGDTTAAITVPTNADYVDKTTAQSIAGVKTFSDGIVGNVTGNVTGNLTGTASRAISDEDGTSIKTGYVNVAGNQTVTGDKSFTGSNTFNSILPNATNTYALGSSSYQWSAVYAQTYYYNGTAWGLDKENVWLVKQIIKQDTIDITTNPSAEKIGKSLYFYDGIRFWAQYLPVWGTDGSFRMELGLSNYTTSGGQGYWVVANKISKDFSTLDFYTSHGNANLGTSTNKWKTLNGINPGALSLPDYDSTAKVNISGSITPDQYGNIYYTPPINGWLYVSFNISNATTSDSIFYIQAKDNNVANSSFLQTSWMPTSGGTELAIFFPVVANKQFIIQINFSNYTIIKAHIIPCLGNV